MGGKRGFWPAGLFLSVVWVGLGFGSVSGAEKVKIRFAESWVLSAENIGEFVALDKGWYAEEGIDITIRRGHGAADTFKRVAAGELDIGRSVLVSVALGRGTGAKVRIVQVIMHTSPYGLAYLEGIGVSRPKDLEGRKVGIPAGSSVLQFWPAFAKVNAIDPGKVTILNIEAAALPPSLAAHSVDAVDSWLVNLPAFEDAAAQTGRKVGYFLWSDYGLKDMYGAAFVASEETIEKRAAMVEKFVRATIRGQAYALAHPKEAVEIFVKHNPGRSEPMTGRQWKTMERLSRDEQFAREGLGFANPEKMEKALDLIRTYVGLKAPVDAKDLYTNAFVERAPREWRFPKLP